MLLRPNPRSEGGGDEEGVESKARILPPFRFRRMDEGGDRVLEGLLPLVLLFPLLALATACGLAASVAARVREA